MARRKATKCAACGEVGGRFTMRGDGKWYHVSRCSKVIRDHQASSTFPFTTTNMGDPNDGPVTVQSMRHLRQLENHYGVQSESYNNNQSNW